MLNIISKLKARIDNKNMSEDYEELSMLDDRFLRLLDVLKIRKSTKLIY